MVIAGTLRVSDHEGRALSTLTEFIGLQRTELQPSDEITRGVFGRSMRLALTHRVAADGLAAAVLLALSTVWLVGSPFSRLDMALVQTALIVPLAFRRVWPSAVFLVVAAIAFGQWLLNVPLLGDVALLVALYTVAAHQSRLRAAAAAGLLEAGVIMAAVRWDPAGTLPRSLLFLTATVVAALFAGRTVASGSRYLAWMDERARRLEVERDQQAVIAAAAERTRIARELHDIVSHSLSVVITLADAAAVVSRADPERGAEAMTEVSEVGRSALSDMRAMFGVLRENEPAPGLEPQPGVAGLGALAERVRATGLAVDLAVEGTPFPLGAAAELTVYRIVQEALTNTIRHASASRASVIIDYDAPLVRVLVADDGTACAPPGAPDQRGHGIAGMRERAALHGGTLLAGPAGPAGPVGPVGLAGPAAGGGWAVSATLRCPAPTGAVA
jgi:signal transduction histidine kinase